jgi:hypothetical protein
MEINFEETEYPKIDTLFMRDNRKVIIPDQFTNPLFGHLSELKWEATEKIDGTNIRVIVLPPEEDGRMVRVEFMGREEVSEIPKRLLEKLKSLFPVEKLNEVLNSGERKLDNVAVLYGEGYGVNIQKCGKRYNSKDVDFILFDVKIGKWWLLRDNVEDIANKLGIKVVPIVGHMTIPEAIEKVRNGFLSTESNDKTLQAEGLVLKCPYGICDRSGERIVTKIKTKDFRKKESRDRNDEREMKKSEKLENSNYEGVAPTLKGIYMPLGWENNTNDNSKSILDIELNR